MPINYKKIEASEKLFNEKYGVNFDIGAFEEKISLFENMTGDVDMDEMYRLEFAELYKEAFNGFIAGKTGREEGYISVAQMLDDFENCIMKDYRAGRNSDNKSSPKLYGNKKASDYIKFAHNYLDSVEDFPNMFIKDQYKKGKITLDDAKSYTEKIMKEKNPSIEKLQILNDYSFVLKTVNSRRSIAWKFFHLKQYISEQNYSKKLLNYVAKACGKDDPKLLSDNPKWDKICYSTDDGAIRDFKKNLTTELDTTLWNEKIQSIKDSQRENIEISEMKESPLKSTKNISPEFISKASQKKTLDAPVSGK